MHDIESGQTRPPRTIPLALALLAIFGMLVGIITGIVIMESYRRGVAVAEDMGARLYENLRTDIAVQQQQLAQPITFALSILSEDPALEAGQPANLEGPLFVVLQDNPQLTELRIAYATGELFAVSRLRESDVAQADTPAPPPGAMYATRQVQRDANGDWQTWWTYMDGNRTVIRRTTAASEEVRHDAFPWYAAAMKYPDTTVQTKTALLSSQHAVGMSYARMFGSAKTGVIAADVSLTRLSEILKYLKFDDEDQIFMFDDHDMLVASADIDVTYNAGNGETQADIKRLPHPIVRVMLDRFRSGGTYTSEKLHADGGDFLASVIRLDDAVDGQQPLYLAFATPAATFTGSFVDITRETALISLFILIAAVPVIVWVAQRFARPLKTLAEVTGAIARLDLTLPLAPHNRISELDRLGQSVGHMRNALGQITKFIPKTLVQELVASNADQKVGGARRELSYMFTDVRDFTPLAEAIPAEELMQQMSTYFDALVGEILSQNGTVDKYVGDAIFAFWNAPTLQKDHAILACRTALACRAASETLNARWRETGRPEWYTRFGVHLGEAVVGNVGSRDRLDYTAIGNAVNMAARLEGLNKFYGSQILVSDAVKERVGDAFLFRSVDRVLVKGAATPMIVHELICARANATPNDMARCTAWETAFNLHQERDWSAALTAAEALVAADHADSVAVRFLERITEAMASGSTWDGVTRLDTK